MIPASWFQGAYNPDEAEILSRLKMRPATGVTGPDRRAAAMALQARGIVVAHEGEGRDRGVLLVSRPALNPHALAPNPFEGRRS